MTSDAKERYLFTRNITFVSNQKTPPMEIVNIEAGTFKEMVTAWNSLKSELKELQNIYLRKEPDEWLDSKEVCEILCVSPRSLQHLRNSGTLSLYPDRQKNLLSKARCRVIINNSTKEKIVMGEIITKTNKEVLQFFDEMKRISTFIDALKSGYTPSLNGERFLTDTELSEMLKLTKRTLLEYRNCGKIPYYQIGGKILYRENDIEKLLYENRRDTF